MYLSAVDSMVGSSGIRRTVRTAHDSDIQSKALEVADEFNTGPESLPIASNSDRVT